MKKKPSHQPSSAKKPVVYAFIDSQNVNLGVRSQGWKLDFKRFYVYLQDKYKVSKVFLFIGYLETNQSLYSNLKKWGYQLVFKPAIRFGKLNIKGYEELEKEKKLYKIIAPSRKSESSLIKRFRDYKLHVEDIRPKVELKP